MVDQLNKPTSGAEYEEQESGFLNMRFFLKTFLLNWQWIALSAIICVALSFLYLRYTTPVYQVTAKILIKDEDNTRSRFQNQIQAATNLGFMSNSEGFDNEIEILKSVNIAEQSIRDLKLYVSYKVDGRLKDRPVYKTNPVVVDMDKAHLDTLTTAVQLSLDPIAGGYEVKGVYYDIYTKEKVKFERSGALPMNIVTRVGVISVKYNTEVPGALNNKKGYKAVIVNPTELAQNYAYGMDVSPLSKTTTIANVTLKDALYERSIDYLTRLTEVYNIQANEDKNQIAVRTEKFINERLEKINAELGSTDGAIENYKRSNNMVDIQVNATQSVKNTDEYEKKLQEIDTQILLLESLDDFMKQPANKYQTLPNNVGLQDPASTALIAQYNQISVERSTLLNGASEMSPAVKQLTATLDQLFTTIERAMAQNKKSLKLQRNTLAKTQSNYENQMNQKPQQERFLTEIGRQQTVKSSLYIMLLEKREENSISLAATADKGKLIDVPEYVKVKPKGSIILLLGLILGIALPFVVFILLEMLRFRIEGHEDVANMTKMPIIADIPIANESAKTKGEIVVQENRNNHMEEIYRSMRTNIQFMLKEGQNVVMFTSSVSGEGKTFIAANLAVSFALLGKKVALVGLDIRRPRLAELFEMRELRHKGISMLLSKNNVTLAEIKEQIIPSGVNPNLDILPAGPIPPNPAELVARQSLEDIFDILKKEYDYVIVDTAPVGLVTDTLSISRIADVSVIVCRADYTEKSAFNLFNDLNESNKMPNMCVAINGIDLSKRKYGYAYGYGSYGKYGKYSYGKYGYSKYSYGSYGNYANSHYGNKDDDSIKK